MPDLRVDTDAITRSKETFSDIRARLADGALYQADLQAAIALQAYCHLALALGGAADGVD